jgi:hypothetical protein
MPSDPTPTVTWAAFAAEVPELAAAVAARFTVTKHHVLATLRADGAPRVSGTEVQFFEDDLVSGSMPASRKALDLRGDGRFALHSNPGDGSMEGGDAKVSGTADFITDAAELARYVGQVEPPEPFDLIRYRISQVVLTSMHPAGDRIVVETWRPGRGITRVERS